MQSVKLEVQKRDITGKKVASLRALDLIPAVVYGHGAQSKQISVPYNIFEKVYRQTGESTLIDLVIDASGTVTTLIQEVQKDPVTDRFIHVDFYEVTMTEKLNANVSLKFTGVALAVKELGGTLVKNITEVEVRCLPKDLIHEIEVPLSALATFEDTVTIADLVRPLGVEILGVQDTIVVTVAPPISEEELKKLDEKPVEADVSAIAKVETKKKEETTEEKK